MFHQATNSLGNYHYNKTVYTDVAWGLHFHKNFELIYVISGAVTMTCGGREETLTQGQFAVVFPNVIHGYHTPKRSVSCVLVFSADFVHEFAAAVKRKEGERLGFSCGEPVTSYFCHYMLEGEPDLLMKKSCLYAVCSRYLEEVPLTESSQAGPTSEIAAYVEEHFKQNITLRQAASDLGYEYHYFSRIFHQHFHMNFRQFVNLYRFDCASRLLTESDCSISEAALESGFQCIRSFHTVFQQLAGVSPSQFRAAGRREN